MKKDRYIKLIGFLVLIFIFTIGLDIRMSGWSEAAGSTISIKYGNSTAGEVINMDTSALALSFSVSGVNNSACTVEWSVPITEDQQIVGFQNGSDTSSIVEVSNEQAPVLRAKKTGEGTIKLLVKDSSTGSEIGSITCKINVKLAIDTAVNDFDYAYINDSDTRRSLIMYSGEYKNLQLTVGGVADAAWNSDNKDVVTVTNDGKVTGIGAGKTTVRVMFGEGSDAIDVYVCPKIGIADGTYKTNQNYDIQSGGTLYTDVIFEQNRTLMLKDKITWCIYKLNDKSEKIFLEDSLGNKGAGADLIELTPTDGVVPRNLKVTAKSGEYYVDFYPSNIYKGIDSVSTGFPSNKINTIKLNVSKGLPNSQITLNVGDSYSLSDAFNITNEELNTWFWDPIISDSNTISYTSSNGEINAKEMSNNVITVVLKPKHEYMSKLSALYGTAITEGAGFTFYIKTIDVLTLDQTNVRLVEGESRQLTPTTTTYDGAYEWKSSDESLVSVTQTGMITGLKTTTDDVTITVSLKLTNGSIKKATCKVRVVATVNTITLNKEKVALNVGDQASVIATFDPERSEAPICWAVSDETIATIEVDSTGKSVVINAVSPGTATLMALNSDNYVTAFCKITVLQPVTGIELDQTQLTVKLNREVVRLNATLTPEDTTSTELEWLSSDTSVATVDNTGLVTLVSAGTTLITVKPKINSTPPIMAQCTLTVLQSSSSLTFDKTEMTLEVGEKSTINYSLLPENSSAVITWNTLDSAIASVNNTGQVTAVAVGQTYITATTEEGYIATCLVKVGQQATGVVLDVTDLTLDVGDVYTVNYTLQPVDSTESGLTWTSQDITVATVTSDGRITGVSPGKTTIYVKTKSGNVEYIFVEVRQSVKGVSLNYNTKEINKGESFSLEAIFSPSEVTNTNVTWKSSNEKVVTVSKVGKVKGIAGGAAVITCITEDGNFEANCIVTVTETATTVKLNKSSYTLGLGKSITLKATVGPSSVTSKKVKWTSSNTKIAKVTSAGKVTGKKIGNCTIKAKATDGSGVYAVCTIKVVQQATSVRLNKMYLKMYVGASYKLKAAIKPKNVTKKTVSWSSNHSDIVLAGTSGKITALSTGRAIITVKTKDNSNKRAKCVIDVIERVPVTEITAADTSIVMVKGTSQSVAFTVSPANTTDKISYSSDNHSVATVNSDGRVKAVSPGIATITAKTTNGKYAIITVTVVGLNRTSMTLEQYSTDQLWVEEDTGLTVKWSSDNSDIARVDTDGNVTARRIGTTRIIANVNGVKLYCTVTVIKIPNTN